MADIAKRKIWTRGQTWLLIFVGLFPIFMVLLIIWYAHQGLFQLSSKYGGLLKRDFVAWFLYLLFMFVGHLVSPWRRELI